MTPKEARDIYDNECFCAEMADWSSVTSREKAEAREKLNRYIGTCGLPMEELLDAFGDMYNEDQIKKIIWEQDPDYKEFSQIKNNKDSYYRQNWKNWEDEGNRKYADRHDKARRAWASERGWRGNVGSMIDTYCSKYEVSDELEKLFDDMYDSSLSYSSSKKNEILKGLKDAANAISDEKQQEALLCIRDTIKYPAAFEKGGRGVFKDKSRYHLDRRDIMKYAKEDDPNFNQDDLDAQFRAEADERGNAEYNQNIERFKSNPKFYMKAEEQRIVKKVLQQL